MPILKINLGLCQCWILLELYMRIKVTTQLTDSKKSVAANDVNINLKKDIKGTRKNNDYDFDPIKINKRIMKGRLCVISFIVMNILALSSYLSYLQATLNLDELKEANRKWDSGCAYALFVMFVLHLICVIRLISVLKKSRD